MSVCVNCDLVITQSFTKVPQSGCQFFYLVSARKLTNDSLSIKYNKKSL